MVLFMRVCEEEKDGMGWWRAGGGLRAGRFTVLEGVALGGRIGRGGEGVGKGFDKGGGRMVREECILAAREGRTEGRREWVWRLSLEECCSGEVPTS